MTARSRPCSPVVTWSPGRCTTERWAGTRPAELGTRRPGGSWRRPPLPSSRFKLTVERDENSSTWSTHPRTGRALSATGDGDPRQDPLFAGREVRHLPVQRAWRPRPRPLGNRPRRRAEAAVSFAPGGDRYRGEHLFGGNAPTRAAAPAGDGHHGLHL